jgi:hypothetical protein
VADAAEVNDTPKSNETARARGRADGVLRRTRVQKGVVATGDTQRAPAQPLEDSFNLAGRIKAFHEPKGMLSARLGSPSFESEREVALYDPRLAGQDQFCHRQRTASRECVRVLRTSPPSSNPRP